MKYKPSSPSDKLKFIARRWRIEQIKNLPVTPEQRRAIIDSEDPPDLHYGKLYGFLRTIGLNDEQIENVIYELPVEYLEVRDEPEKEPQKPTKKRGPDFSVSAGSAWEGEGRERNSPEDSDASVWTTLTCEDFAREAMNNLIESQVYYDLIGQWEQADDIPYQEAIKRDKIQRQVNQQEFGVEDPVDVLDSLNSQFQIIREGGTIDQLDPNVFKQSYLLFTKMNHNMQTAIELEYNNAIAPADDIYNLARDVAFQRKLYAFAAANLDRTHTLTDAEKTALRTQLEFIMEPIASEKPIPTLSDIQMTRDEAIARMCQYDYHVYVIKHQLDLVEHVAKILRISLPTTSKGRSH